ncbi:hypothetical protein ACO2Q4_05705 [Paracoccus sp. KR1-242]
MVNGAVERGQIPAQPLVDISAGPGRVEVLAALVVDLPQAIAKAQEAKARSLDIYADTLQVPGKSVTRIQAPLLHVTIIARRIVVDDTGQIYLDHSGDNPLAALRVLTAELACPLAIASARAGKHPNYDLQKLSEKQDVPKFTNFVWRDTGPAIGETNVPPGLLARGEALHSTLAATFHLVAGLLATGDEDPEVLTLCHSMLRWIASWSGLQSDLAQIARLADTLRAIMPSYTAGKLVRPIPPLTAATYLSLARARKDLAKAIELDAHFLDQSNDTGQIAKLFVKANLGRDDAESKLIVNSMEALQAEIDSIQEALERAARALKERQLEQELDEIYLERAQAHDQIDKIVDASFQLAIGLVTLGVSIAAICMGVPADPTASAKKDIQGVQGLFDAMKNTRQVLPGGTSAPNELKNILRLYALPFTFAFNNIKDHKDSIKALAESAVQIKKAASAILKSGKPGDEQADFASELGEATRRLASSPSPLEARAAWDSLEATAVNALDVVINDPDTAGSIKKAAVDYKTAIQKVAIYGRLMAEQQARKDAALRALGAMTLQKLAQAEKTAAYARLATELTDREALAARIRSEIDVRQDEAARSFFCACYGLRGAQYYETYTPPATLPALPHRAADLEAIYSDFTGDVEATSGLRGKAMDFTRDIIINDPEVLKDFANGRLVSIRVQPDHPDLSKLKRLRLTGLEVWAETRPELSDMVGIDIISSTTFDDRGPADRPQFTGESRRISFEYQGNQPRLSWTGAADSVLPTPFAEWSVTLYRPNSIPVPEALRLRLVGKALA